MRATTTCASTLALLTLLACAVGHAAEAEILVSREARNDTEFMLVPRISRSDLAQGRLVTAQPTTAHNDCLTDLTDGQMANDYGPVFGNGLKVGKYKLDLGAVKDIAQVNTYSYRQGNRVQQKFTLYGSRENTDPGWDVTDAGRFQRIATVDTTNDEPDRYLGTCVRSRKGDSIGRYRWLVWVVLPVTPVAGGEHAAYQEFDVVGVGATDVSAYHGAEEKVVRADAPPVKLEPADVNILMADRAKRNASLQEFTVWGKSEGRAWVKNWRRPEDFFQWPVDVPDAGQYEVSVLAQGKAAAEAEIVSEAGRVSFQLPKGWDKVTLLKPLQLPKGRSTITLRLLKPDNACLKSLELINVSARADIQHRVQQVRASTQWLRDAKYGLMFQWGGWGFPQHGPPKPWPKMIDDFDAEAFARMAEDAGAAYVIWSVTWCRYLFPAPIKAIDRIAPGYTSQWDLVGDLADALAKRNIRLMLYYHNGHDEKHWWPKNWDYADPDRKEKFVNNLCAILTEVGERYGKKVSGWFIDDGMLFYPAPFERITRALKAGNPDRLVSYNAWVLPRLTEFQEVYMGEGFRGSDATAVGGDGIFPAGPQKGLFAQGMFVLDGPDWGINHPDTKINKPCFKPQQAVELIQRASTRGQTLSFNLLMYEDGSVSPESLEVMRSVRKAIRGR